MPYLSKNAALHNIATTPKQLYHPAEIPWPSRIFGFKVEFCTWRRPQSPDIRWTFLCKTASEMTDNAMCAEESSEPSWLLLKVFQQ